VDKSHVKRTLENEKKRFTWRPFEPF